MAVGGATEAGAPAEATMVVMILIYTTIMMWTTPPFRTLTSMSPTLRITRRTLKIMRRTLRIMKAGLIMEETWEETQEEWMEEET